MIPEITGTVRVDLAAIAPDQWCSGEFVMVDAPAYMQLWRAMQGAEDSFTFELWIGAARSVAWIDPRCRDLLGRARRVVFVGSNPSGVETAIRSLRRLFDGTAA